MVGMMRRRWRFMWRYWRGHTPWDSGIVPPEVIAWLEAAQAAGRPPGRALDLGCGTGTTSIELAARGWMVTGVDFAANAIWQARRKARARSLAGLATFRVADVTAPDFLSDAPPVDLAIDVGCLHGLTVPQRAIHAAHLTRLTRPGAEFLLYAFMPRVSNSGRPMGLTPEGVRALFAPAFSVVDQVVGEDVTHPVPSVWYTLRRLEDRP